jgi:hypothetical protein
MAKSFKALMNNMPAERRSKIHALTRELLSEIPLHDLQHAHELTQQQMASDLNLDQEEIERIEWETDLYISTFKRFITAMGGELQLVVNFPHGHIAIKDFQHIERSKQ